MPQFMICVLKVGYDGRVIISLTPDAARDFRLQLQKAREYALKDAEAFDGIIHVIERLGSFCFGKIANLGKYQDALVKIAERSPLASEIPGKCRTAHTPFTLLLDMIRQGRNDALHIGASARYLTNHSIELALILEDALKVREERKCVSDYMVRNPACARLWQPVSLVRQQMLTNSFSYLPVKDAAGDWRLVSDLKVAKYLQNNNGNRNQRLAKPLEEVNEIELIEATRLCDNTPISEAMNMLGATPILVVRENARGELVGILTAFDLL